MILLGWLGCAGPVEPACVPDGPHLVLVTTDFEVGALAAVSPDGACIGDALATVGADSVTRWTGDRVAVVQRTGGDALRLYDPGHYDAPALEVALEQGSNTHDLVQVGDELWSTPWERAELVVTGLDGARLGSVDLAGEADADGLPEPDHLVVRGDRLYVALQRLDREQGFGPGDGGRVLEIDPAGRSVSRSWDTGPNPKLYPHPDDPDALVVLTGVFFALDGALSVLRPDDGGLLPPLLTEADVGVDLTVLAGTADGAVWIGVDPEVGGPSRLECLSLADGASRGRVDTDAWPVAAVAGDDGGVWVAVRENLGAGEGGLWRVDPTTCEREVVADGFRLDPFDLVWVP